MPAPPVPPEVIRLTQDWEVGGQTSSTSWWLRNSLNASLDELQANLILTSYLATALQPLLGMMHSEIQATTCRLRGVGINAVTFAPPNRGAWTGATELAVATGIKWNTLEGGRRRWAATYLPGTPASFVDGHWQFNETGFATVLANAAEFLAAMNDLPATGFGTQQLGTVHRRVGVTYIPDPVFFGFSSGYPVLKLCTIGRRIPPSRGVLPV